MSCLRSQLAAIAGAVRIIRCDTRGVTAVEFGLIAPVLMIMLIGAIEATRAIALDQRLSLATNMVADLVAREQVLTSADVTKIYEVVEEVMEPYGADGLRLVLIPVMSAPNNASQTLVYPSKDNRPSLPPGSEPAKCQPYTLAKDLLKANESVIVVEARYTYAPLFLSWSKNPFKSDDKAEPWLKTAYAKPRKSLCVAFDGANCTSSCFSS